MDRDTAVREVLMTAESYLKNTDRLIYSYAGKTYLSGAPILDRDFQDRGNIDCSTYVHLVLQGVPYEESPYVTGNAEDTFRSAAAWRAIAHVGIVSEDTEYIYHSTGYPEKARSEKENLKAIQRTHILEGRTPNLYARPFYGGTGGRL